MEHQNQKALDSLWLGKNGNIAESLLFAVFVFLFSFALTTAPEAFSPGAQVIVGTADGIGQGYEQVILHLDRNVSLLPEVAAGLGRDLSMRIDAMQERNQETVRGVVSLMQMPATKLVRWQGVRVNRPYR